MVADPREAHGGVGASNFGSLFADPALGSQRVEHPSGSVIHDAASDAQHVYYIQQGQIRLYLPAPAHDRVGAGRLLEILGPGQWFGIGGLSHARTHIAKAVAVSRTTLLVARADKFLEIVSARPMMAMQVMQHVADAVRGAREDAGRLVFDDCNQRLIKTLVRFASSAAATQQNGETVLQITHEQLAQAVGVARETVSLALTEFRHQNLVRTGRNQLTFNTNALREFGARRNSNGKSLETLEQVA